MPRRLPPDVFQHEIGVTICQELINHAGVRLAVCELGAEALSHQLSGVGSWLVALDTGHPLCLLGERGSNGCSLAA